MLEALIFDFDGLIVDTESTVLQSWAELYREFGVELPLGDWLRSVGADYGPDTFDPYADLEAQVGRPLDWETLRPRRYAREIAMANRQPPLPGVVALLDDAQAHGLRLAVASSSSHRWVDGHLQRLGLFRRFDAVVCAEDVARAKPAPDLFLKAVEALGVPPKGVVVLEDSANGVIAARAAGLFCVVVPSELTRHLNLSAANMRVQSLAELSVDLLDRALRNNHHEGG